MAEAITDDGCELDILMSSHKASQLGLHRTLQSNMCTTVADAIVIENRLVLVIISMR